MKIKNLIVLSLLAALSVGTSAYGIADSYNYSSYTNVTHNNENGSVTITVKDGANLSAFDMFYYTQDSGEKNDDGVLIGGAYDPLLHKSYKDNGTVKSVTINLEGGEGLKQILGIGYSCSNVSGPITINVNGGNHGMIIGGVHYPSGVQPISEQGVFAPKNENNDVTITVNGGHVDEIRGGNNNSASKIHDYIVANGTGDRPWAHGGDVKIVINGGTVGTAINEDAIVATGSCHSIDGDVSVEINAGEVTGIVYAGGRNSYSEIGGDTFVAITGGKVDGSVYAGGTINDNKYGSKDAPAPIVKGSTKVEMTGGEVTGDLYGAGDTDTVEKDTVVTIGGDAIVGGNVYGAGKNSTVGGNATVAVNGGTVGGNVYGGGENSTIGKDVVVTINGADVKGDVYGAGKDSTVAGTSTVKLLAGNVDGTVSAAGENSTVKSAIIQVGSDTQAFEGSVGDITGFDKMIVAEGSKITQTGGNAFGTRIQSYTLSSANLTEAVVTLGSGATVSVEDSITLNLAAAGELASGKYMLVDASGAAAVDLSNWTEDMVIVNGLEATFEDLTWGDDNVLYFTIRSADVVNVMAANWGVFKSSQAFVSTLWGNRSNCVEIKPAVVADGKGGLVSSASSGRTLAWGAAYGQSARISGVGADYSLWGGAVGVEHRFVSARSIGAAVGYDWGTVSPFNTSDIDQESAHVALYGRAATWQVGQKGAITLDWSAALGRMTSETNVIAGDWTQNNMQLDARVSYLRKLSDRTTASVFGGLQYFAAEDATVEGIDISSMQNLRAELGAGLSRKASQKTTVFGEVSVYGDIMRHDPYAVVDAVRFEGTNPGRVGGTITAGAVYELNDSWSLRGSYSFEAASDSTEHNVNVGAGYSF